VIGRSHGKLSHLTAHDDPVGRGAPRTEGPKRKLGRVGALIINHNRINVREKIGQTDRQTDTRPLLYAYRYGRGQGKSGLRTVQIFFAFSIYFHGWLLDAYGPSP